ncbi:hypothetical protein AMATHDRAFT_139431 [Amanita thiersii Skay4041]|uniref:DUF2423 domain-containing protein n=1 Tax=Amanita thiersii Skay4041 TaxID=703135 RepID=A0A2A9NY05_9AGAR|nr:hypothetical protein AMATHDRAFT_139431 [Amanita thiersii Skay4041]
MAKSTRSKVKRAYRHRKRETGVYAAAEAARLHRLNAKLVQAAALNNNEADDKGEDASLDDTQNMEGPMPAGHQNSHCTRISTHGFRNSRREEWRRSKGLAPRPRSRSNHSNWQGNGSTRKKVAHSRKSR